MPDVAPAAVVGWQEAWEAALYGPAGFYRRPEGPAGHFRTATHAAASHVARAVLALARHHGCRRVLDIGAGRGELLTAAHSLDTSLPLHGTDVVARPAALPATVGWSAGLDAVPAAAFDGAFVVAWELLDVVPCPVVEVDDDRLARYVLVEPRTGREHLGDLVDGVDRAWCERWWPVATAQPGERLEVGRPRDALWRHLVGRTRDGALLAVDYGHLLGGRPPAGSLSGFRAGRQVPAVPDGSCDLTAEVAMDAVAAAGEEAGARWTRLTTQTQALRDGGAPRELTDPGGLGAFAWLVQTTTSR